MSSPFPVLVTGGAGYIGSHAVLALRDRGTPVAVIDNLSTGFRFAIPEGVAFYEGDVGDSALLARIFAEQKIGAVMHFAGSIIVPESVENPLKYYHNNTANSRSLIEAVVKAGVPHMIFSSTAATYGIPAVSPVSEDVPKQPINPYGWSKLMTEQMLADTAAAHAFNYCALRYFNVAGADPEQRTGQSTPGATHLIKRACQAALGRLPKGQAFDHGAHLVHVAHMVEVQRRHLQATAGRVGQHAFLAQQRQGLLHRLARDAELLRELFLDDAFARAQLAQVIAVLGQVPWDDAAFVVQARTASTCALLEECQAWVSAAADRAAVFGTAAGDAGPSAVAAAAAVSRAMRASAAST